MYANKTDENWCSEKKRGGCLLRRKFTIDKATRGIVLGYVQKYDEYKKWLMNAREDIEYRGRRPIDGMPKGSIRTDSTGDKAVMLCELEESHRNRIVSAIDEAKLHISAVFPSIEEGRKLTRAIMESCKDSRSNFEAFAGLIPCERTAFYEYKARFIREIKDKIGI